MDTGLHDKSILVTGATANIGRVIALAFAREGARLTLVGRDIQKGDEVACLARAAGASAAMFVPTDMTQRADVEAMIATAINRFGGVDVLVNNVGGTTGCFTLFAETDPEGWQAELDLNITSTLLCTRSALPHMIAAKAGRIINIGSTAGEAGDYMASVYSATKGAVHSFTRALAGEVGEHGITVNCVAPYATFPDDRGDVSSGSRFHKDGIFAKDAALADETTRAKLLRTPRLPRQAARPGEIAAAVLYFASEVAGYTTGQLLCVDGGALL